MFATAQELVRFCFYVLALKQVQGSEQFNRMNTANWKWNEYEFGRDLSRVLEDEKLELEQ
jgi:hypothetical protein